MTNRKRQDHEPPPSEKELSPRATGKEHERIRQRGTGSRDVPGSAAGSIEGAGTPGGGSEVGGLGGTNIGDGAPENADLNEVLGSGIHDTDEYAEAEESLPLDDISEEEIRRKF